MFKIIFILIAVLISFAQSKNLIFETALSPRNANYSIQAILDPDSFKIIGNETITWTNITENETSELQFHLYLNGYKNKESTFLSESSGNHRGSNYNPKRKGYIDISNVRVNDQEISYDFIQPDDANENDSTVFRITLDSPVKPNETVKIDLAFESKLPQIFARTGYYDSEDTKEFFMAAQWFPKIGVLENNGWNCHQLHGNTEFFSDYGVYDVAITVPSRFKIGATGILHKQSNKSKHTTYEYHAEDVHDFAWTAYPDFKIYTTLYKEIAIRFLYNPGEEELIEKEILAIKHSIDFTTKYIGKYPYPNLTLVNVPKGAHGAGGMEYPTLITNWGQRASINALNNHDLSSDIYQLVAVHEYAHQYFYGLLGSNEFEHAWMDEGLTTFLEQEIIDDSYNGTFGTKDFNLTKVDVSRSELKAMHSKEPIFTTSYKQEDYYQNAYSKPPLYLTTLKNYMGKDLFWKGIKTYFNRFKFKHPKPDDFIRTMSEVSGENLDWFFVQFFEQTLKIDYSVSDLATDSVQIPKDYIFYFPKTDQSKPLKKNSFTILNTGDGYFPVNIRITLKNNRAWTLPKWDYKSDSLRIEFYANEEILRVHVDPNQVAIIDQNMINNVLSFESTKEYTLLERFKFFSLQFIELLAGF